MFHKTKREIETRIMNVIRDKIAEKQAEYDEGAWEINNKVMDDIELITERGRKEKLALSDKCVNDIIGKIV